MDTIVSLSLPRPAQKRSNRPSKTKSQFPEPKSLTEVLANLPLARVESEAGGGFEQTGEAVLSRQSDFEEGILPLS